METAIAIRNRKKPLCFEKYLKSGFRPRVSPVGISSAAKSKKNGPSEASTKPPA